MDAKTSRLVRALPAPNSRAQVHEFLRLTAFYRAYLPGVYVTAAPLRDLLAPNSNWFRGQLPAQALQAFFTIQDQLVLALDNEE